MPADIGEMFYYKATERDVPWHGLGVALAERADLATALKVGGLNWKVEKMPLMTAEDPPSPVERRVALVRSDRTAGHEDRVVGVAHPAFTPVQNDEAGMLFDAVFGSGEKVYETGGYLGIGERIWLLAKLDRVLTVGKKDTLSTYALLANSHDGTIALTICLTTVRVVCQNTLSFALDQDRKSKAPSFRRSHSFTFREHAQAAREFFQHSMNELDSVEQSFIGLSGKPCTKEKATEIIKALVPLPQKPSGATKNPAVRKNWETRLRKAEEMRRQIIELLESGRGMELDTSAGTFWGLLNAVTEYVDHHTGRADGDRLVHSLLGDGMAFKMKAYNEISKAAKAA
jgi:phage/plasmid-like protein (TIGR03299 family)